jgi:hypothetical protein
MASIGAYCLWCMDVDNIEEEAGQDSCQSLAVVTEGTLSTSVQSDRAVIGNENGVLSIFTLNITCQRQRRRLR